MKLIFNADDLGLTKGVTNGIIKAHREGVLTSTTMMVNMPYINLCKKAADENPKLGIGIHLVLTAGKPLVKNLKSIVDENGDFYNYKVMYEKSKPINAEEVYIEWKAQIDKFISIMGKKPSHIDSHHHIHLMWPGNIIIERLVNEYDIPMRTSSDDLSNYNYEKANLCKTFYEDNADMEYFYKDKEGILNHNISEVMCHPAIVDDELKSISSYCNGREIELSLILNPKLKKWIKDNKIELINYNDIKKVAK